MTVHFGNGDMENGLEVIPATGHMNAKCYCH